MTIIDAGKVIVYVCRSNQEGVGSDGRGAGAGQARERDWCRPGRKQRYEIKLGI